MCQCCLRHGFRRHLHASFSSHVIKFPGQSAMMNALIAAPAAWHAFVKRPAINILFSLIGLLASGHVWKKLSESAGPLFHLFVFLSADHWLYQYQQGSTLCSTNPAEHMPNKHVAVLLPPPDSELTSAQPWAQLKKSDTQVHLLSWKWGEIIPESGACSSEQMTLICCALWLMV